MTMRTCWIVCDVPAGNRLALSCPGHKSKGSTTKRCMLGKKKQYQQHINPLETHHPPLWQPVATRNHHVPSITARETMLRLVGWQAGSPWRRKDLADDSMESEAERESEVWSPAGCHRAPRRLYVSQFSFKRINSSFQQRLIRLISPNEKCWERERQKETDRQKEREEEEEEEECVFGPVFILCVLKVVKDKQSEDNSPIVD